LFAPVAKAAHVYESRTATTRPTIPIGDVPSIDRSRATLAPHERPSNQRIWPADLHQRLLEQYAPPSLVVTDESQLVHVSDSAARYLEIGGGEPSRDVVKLAVPELRVDLRTALHQ